MSTAAQRFQSEFLKSPSQKRAALIQKVVALNQQNTEILNLLANVDINYKPNTNLIQEAASWRRADNIYFICKMLTAFPDFRYE